MWIIQLSATLLGLAGISMVGAHTLLSRLYVDNVSLGDSTCLRHPNGGIVTQPVIDLTSDDVVCGYNGLNGVQRICSVPVDSKLTFEMRWYPDKSQPGFIDPGHKGPCAVYMKKVNSASQESGAGDGWFKIFEDGYDPATDKFCTEKLNDSNGELSVKLPHGILGGEYLIRTEITALHLTGSPQLYVGCAQIFVVSTGTGVPCSTVSIPGYVTQNDPITQYSVYNRPFVLPFPFFGPPVYLGGESGTVDAPQQTEGFCPPNTVVENGDWCGEEVPLYHDTQSCWDVYYPCQNANDNCVGNQPPTGPTYCSLYGKKCDDIRDACIAGNFDPPANYGQNLMPPAETVPSLPAATPVTDQGKRRPPPRATSSAC